MNGTALQFAERPRRQLAHSPHEIWNGTLTIVPGGVDAPALSPASRTSATHSCPSGNGGGNGEPPWTIIASRSQVATARGRTSAERSDSSAGGFASRHSSLRGEV